MNVEWTEAALADLRAVEAFIDRHSPHYARGMVERNLSRSEQLGATPRPGPIMPEYDDESLRESFEDPFRIVYRVGEGRIDITAIVHASRRSPRGL